MTEAWTSPSTVTSPHEEFYEALPNAQQQAREPRFTSLLFHALTQLKSLPETDSFPVAAKEHGIPRWFLDPEWRALGGNGRVEKAWDAKLGRFVAIKTLFLEHYDSAEESMTAAQHLTLEAHALTQLESHPHLPHVYDLVRHSDQLRMVMEWIGPDQGLTMDEFLSPLSSSGNRQNREGKFVPAFTSEFLQETLLQLGEVCDHLCEYGRAHFDIKPANIFLTRTGVKLVDFGISQRVNVSGGPLGTPAYVPPEVYFASQPPITPEIAKRREVFSLAATLYEFISGQRLFVTSTLNERPDVVFTHNRALPTALSRLGLSDAHIERCCETMQRALLLAPEMRQESCTQLAQDIVYILSQAYSMPVSGPAKREEAIAYVRAKSVTKPLEAPADQGKSLVFASVISR